MLDTGCWMLDVGYWKLDVGCWVFVYIGCGCEYLMVDADVNIGCRM